MANPNLSHGRALTQLSSLLSRPAAPPHLEVRPGLGPARGVLFALAMGSAAWIAIGTLVLTLRALL